MADNFGVQASFTIPSGEQYEKGDMINIRGASAQEFHKNLTEFQQHCIDLTVEVGAQIRQLNLLKRQMGATTIEHSQQAPPQQPQAAPQAAPQQSGGGWGQQPQQAPQEGPPQWATGGQAQQPGQWQQPQPQQQAPVQDNGGIPTSPPPSVGPPPQCSHGVKNYLAKPYKNGKPGYWQAWACPAQRGDNTQHELEFIRTS